MLKFCCKEKFTSSLILLLFNDFLTALEDKNYAVILSLVKVANKSHELKSLIEGKLKYIPWRISCEYRKTNRAIIWANTKIKIGWWSEEYYEISKQLENSIWSDDYDESYAESDDIYCSVYSGKGGPMLLRLFKILKGQFKTNVAFDEYKGRLLPKDINTSKNCTYYDLADIEVGELKYGKEHNFDYFRILDLVQHDSVVFYKGSTLGMYFKEKDF